MIEFSDLFVPDHTRTLKTLGI